VITGSRGVFHCLVRALVYGGLSKVVREFGNPGLEGRRLVRTHDYAAGGSTGWHTHPGPVFVNVIEGQLTFYEADDPTCTPHVVMEGQGYVDTGRGHLARNETGLPAKDVSVILAPVNLPFRGELPEPNPYCGF
jgi:hypothetical protein